MHGNRYEDKDKNKDEYDYLDLDFFLVLKTYVI